MGRTPVPMPWLRRRVERAGHVPHRFAYSLTFETPTSATAHLARLIELSGSTMGMTYLANFAMSLISASRRCLRIRIWCQRSSRSGQRLPTLLGQER